MKGADGCSRERRVEAVRSHGVEQVAFPNDSSPTSSVDGQATPAPQHQLKTTRYGDSSAPSVDEPASDRSLTPPQPPASVQDVDDHDCELARRPLSQTA
jgi:hypothetical protein